MKVKIDMRTLTVVSVELDDTNVQDKKSLNEYRDDNWTYFTSST